MRCKGVQGQLQLFTITHDQTHSNTIYKHFKVDPGKEQKWEFLLLWNSSYDSMVVCNAAYIPTPTPPRNLAP